MKHLIALLFLVFCVGISAVDLVTADFASALPAGWTQTGSAYTHWAYSNTSNAGGTAGELSFTWSPSETGTLRYISPAFNTLYAHNMTLSFKQAVDWYADTFTLAVQMSTDLNTWNTIWSSAPTADVAAQTINTQASWSWGRSATTYLAFVFTGNTYNINSWMIDNLSFTYTNTLGAGTWPAGTYYPYGNVIVPSGQTLSLQPGTTVNMASNTTLQVAGSIRAIGTGPSKIYLTTMGASTTWYGIDIFNVTASNDSTILEWCVIERSTDTGVEIENSSKVRISSCELKYNSSSVYGGGLRCSNSNIIVDACFFQVNSASLGGSGLDIFGGVPTITRNRFYHNSLTGANARGALLLRYCNVSNVSSNFVMNNYFSLGSYAISIEGCTGAFRYNLVSNNASVGINVDAASALGDIDHCVVVFNDDWGMRINSPLRIVNSIVWDNSGFEINNLTGTDTSVQIDFCCVHGGFYGLSWVAQSSYQNCIESDPLFKNPSEGAGSGYDSYGRDWRLDDLSPCIDAGDYMSGAWDDDFSNPDIGLYARRLKPTVFSAADVFPDQGHQIDLRWYPNDKDVTWDPAAWYHVFRMASDRVGDDPDAVYVTDPRDISAEMMASNRKIMWVHQDRVLTYLGQVKAMNRDAYSLIVPTIQDSSATGEHGESFVVTYFDNVYFWDSVGLQGHSVDNIPPMAPTGAVLSRLAGNSFRLEWNEVTEGLWEGNSYPETNAITYLIYASDVPYFEPGPQNFVIQTSDLSTLFTNLSADRRFFRIVASDSQ